MNVSVIDLEKIVSKSKYKEKWVVDFLNIKVVQKSKTTPLTKEEINKLAKLADRRIDDFFSAGPSY